VTLANKQEFEKIVGEVNQVKEGVRQKTIQKLAKLATESQFTVVSVGVENPPFQLNVSDEDEPCGYPCFKSGCPLSFGDVAARKEHLLRDHNWKLTPTSRLISREGRLPTGQAKGRKGLRAASRGSREE